MIRVFHNRVFTAIISLSVGNIMSLSMHIYFDYSKFKVTYDEHYFASKRKEARVFLLAMRTYINMHVTKVITNYTHAIAKRNRGLLSILSTRLAKSLINIIHHI